MLAPTRVSLITGAADSLREAIAKGEFRERLPGVRALSNKLCVSIPTVLEAIRILAKEGTVAVKHGHPTRVLAAQSSKPRGSGAKMKQAFFLVFWPIVFDEASIRYAVDELERQGYSVASHHYGSWRHSRSELDRIVRLNPSDCWVLLGSPREVQQYFASRKLPTLVACGLAQQGVALPDFEMDFSAVYRHAAHQFLNLGHRNIHLVLGESSARKNEDSLNAFVSAVQERLPDRTAKQLVKVYDGSVPGLRALLVSLFSGREKPTGLCVALVSRYVFTQCWLTAKGFSIPGDVSLICRDGDDHLMECLIPSPAYYSYQAKNYARRLARAVVAVLESRRVKTHTLLVPEFLKGDSLGPVSP